MNQHKVILSIGSNLGNKLQIIEDCIMLINNRIATVIAVSKVYETPSWGFESFPFYNAAILIHTTFSAQKLLKKLRKAEIELGRTRTSFTEYEARTIDIDIIAYNEEVIEEDFLVIPHKQMALRKFVLQPMQDLNLQWKHPLLKKSVAQLVQDCPDQSVPKPIHILKLPIANFSIKNFNYVVIEGNIGAGKTTITKRIAEDFNAKIVLERFADNPFLPKFYKDQNRYAFPLEMSFLADRYQQLTDDLSQFDLFKDFIVADYHIFKSLIFAKVTLQEDEFRLYKTMFDIIYKETPKPDLYIYLYQNTDWLLHNIKKRGRSYEQEISAEYLEKINLGYLDFVKTKNTLNIVLIDVSNLDFVKNQEDYIKILQQIENKRLNI